MLASRLTVPGILAPRKSVFKCNNNCQKKKQHSQGGAEYPTKRRATAGGGLHVGGASDSTGSDTDMDVDPMSLATVAQSIQVLTPFPQLCGHCFVFF